MTTTKVKHAVLVRATPENKLFSTLQKVWRQQLTRRKAPKIERGEFDRWSGEIASEIEQDPKYGIYVLCHVKEDGTFTGPYYGYAHVNHRQPGTANEELRLIQHKFAPNMTESVEKQAVSLAQMISSALLLIYQLKTNDRGKIYLEGHAEVTIGKMMVVALETLDGVKASVRGNWLHLEVPPLKAKKSARQR